MKVAKELWAIVDHDGHVCWSRGGSSTPSRLMVYDNEKSAGRALRSIWTRQVILAESVDIVKIYPQKEE